MTLRFKAVSVYVRNNIANIGKLKVNDQFININKYQLKDKIKLSIFL